MTKIFQPQEFSVIFILLSLFYTFYLRWTLKCSELTNPLRDFRVAKTNLGNTFWFVFECDLENTLKEINI